jgi:hypothetical protein
MASGKPAEPEAPTEEKARGARRLKRIVSLDELKTKMMMLIRNLHNFWIRDISRYVALDPFFRL